MRKNTFFSRIGTSIAKGAIRIFGSNNWGSFFQFLGGGEDEDSGQVVTPETGTQVNTIFNCLNILAQDIATFPKQVRQNTDHGKQVVKSPLSRVLNGRPNSWQNSWHFWYSMIFMGEGWGNSFAYISKRDSQGYATELIPLKPWVVVPQVSEGRLYYVVDNQVVVEADDMFHYRSMTTDSFMGEQKIVYNTKTVGLKMKQMKYSAKSVGSKPPGYIKGMMTNEQLISNKANWDAQISGENIAGTPVLNGEVEYKQLMLSPEASEIVLQNQMSDQYLMAIWRIQPSMLSIHQESNYNVVEQQNIVHVKYALNPIIVNLEQEINNKLFPAKNMTAENPEYVKFNVKSLLRGDTATQTAFYQFGTTNGIFNADEVRDWEDLPPQKDSNGNIGIGKKYFIQGAMVDKETPISNDAGMDSGQKQMDLLEGFLKKHKINGYANQD